MENEYNISQTVNRLVQAGYQISRSSMFGYLSNGSGPPARVNGRHRMIGWNDALTWASGNLKIGDNITGTRRDPPINAPEITMDQHIADQIILYLKNEYPEQWKRWRLRHGRHRIELLNEIAKNAIAIAAAEFIGMAVLMADNDDNTDGLPFKMTVHHK